MEKHKQLIFIASAMTALTFAFHRVTLFHNIGSRFYCLIIDKI